MRKPRRSRDSMEVRSACVTKETPMFCNDPKMKSRTEQIDLFERAISGDSMSMPSVMEEEELVPRKTGHCNALPEPPPSEPVQSYRIKFERSISEESVQNPERNEGFVPRKTGHCNALPQPYSPEPVESYRIMFERSISEESTQNPGRAHVSAEPGVRRARDYGGIMEEEDVDERPGWRSREQPGFMNDPKMKSRMDQLDEFDHVDEFRRSVTEPATYTDPQPRQLPPRTISSNVSATKSAAGWKAVGGPLNAPRGTPNFKPGPLTTGTKKDPAHPEPAVRTRSKEKLGVFSTPGAFSQMNQTEAVCALTRSQTEPVADKARGASKRRPSKDKGSSGATDLGPAAFGDPLCGSLTLL